MSIVSQQKKWILFELQHGAKHGYEIAKSTNFPLGSIYNHLAELVKARFIECEKERKKGIKLSL